MRHISAIAVLLVFILGMMAPACVAGWDGRAFGLWEINCQEMPRLSAGIDSARHAGRSSKTTINAMTGDRASEKSNQPVEPCGDELRARAGQCALRSFIQLHFASFAAAEISEPLLVATKVASPSRVTIVVTSVGPPETNRGPPRC